MAISSIVIYRSNIFIPGNSLDEIHKIYFFIFMLRYIRFRFTNPRCDTAIARILNSQSLVSFLSRSDRAICQTRTIVYIDRSVIVKSDTCHLSRRLDSSKKVIQTIQTVGFEMSYAKWTFSTWREILVCSFEISTKVINLENNLSSN